MQHVKFCNKLKLYSYLIIKLLDYTEYLHATLIQSDICTQVCEVIDQYFFGRDPYNISEK